MATPSRAAVSHQHERCRQSTTSGWELRRGKRSRPTEARGKAERGRSTRRFLHSEIRWTKRTHRPWQVTGHGGRPPNSSLHSRREQRFDVSDRSICQDTGHGRRTPSAFHKIQENSPRGGGKTAIPSLEPCFFAFCSPGILSSPLQTRKSQANWILLQAVESLTAPAGRANYVTGERRSERSPHMHPVAPRCCRRIPPPGLLTPSGDPPKSFSAARHWPRPATTTASRRLHRDLAAPYRSRVQPGHSRQRLPSKTEERSGGAKYGSEAFLSHLPFGRCASHRARASQKLGAAFLVCTTGSLPSLLNGTPLSSRGEP